MHDRASVAFARRATWKFLMGALLLLGAAVACAVSDALTGPHTTTISLQYTGATVLILGARVPFAVTALVDGTTIQNPRFRYAIEDSSIITRTATGDTLVARRRGRTVLTISLASPLLPDPPSLDVTLDAVVASVRVSPTLDTLTSLDDTLILVAPAFDIYDAPVAGVVPLWTSSDTTIASFGGPGRLVARGNGQALVRAIVDNDTGVASVVVAQRLARLQLSPANLQLTALTAESTVAAIGVDARGHPVSGVAVSWSSEATSIATVTTDGRVRAVDNGVTRLWVQSGSVRDSLPVIVEQRAQRVVILPDPAPPIVALGDQVSLTAGATDSLGFVVVVPNKTTGWATLDPTVAIVDRNGLVTGVGVGVGRVVAVMDAARDTISVAVGDLPATIEVQPGSATLASVKDTLLLSASVRNSRGNLIPNPVVTWRASDTAIAHVATLPQPLAVAVGAGTVRIIAVAGTVADTCFVTVTNAPVFFDITPSADTLTSTWDSLLVPIVILNARGDTLARSAVQWSSDLPLVGSVTAHGLVIARDTGEIVVRAKYGVAPGDTLRDSVGIRLLNLPASVVLSDHRDTMTAIGQSVAYSGAVRNARGNPVPGYTITWASTNPAVVGVSTGGVVGAAGLGTALVIGQAGGMADTAVLVVLNPTRLIVDNAVASTPRFGTLKRPYARIQDGVNAAELDDTVLVRRGSAPYAETVALTRRVALLGDDSAFAGTLPRNPLLLPLVSHDTGTAGITVNTAATVIIRNFALRHTVSGIAIDARRTDLRVSGFYVNPPGTVAGRIGRGIALDSSTSATASITSSEIRSMRGYGIRVRDGVGVLIDTVLVETVDSIAGVEVGAGIHILRGSAPVVRNATVRGTQGPAILVDSSAGATIASSDLAGRQRLILVRSSNSVTIQNNVLDTRPLGVNGEVFSGGTMFEWAAAEIDSSWQAVVSGNSFRDVAQEPFNAMRLVNVRNPSFPSQPGAQLSANTVVGNRAAIHSQNSNLSIQGSRFDSTSVGIVGTGSDVLTLQNDTIRTTRQDACVRASSASSVTLTASVFQRCTARSAHAVTVSGGFFRVQQSTFLENRAAVMFTGLTFTATANAVSGSGFTPAPGDTLVAVAALQAAAPVVTIVQNSVTGHRFNAGIRAEDGSFSARIDSNFISTNATGVLLGSLSNFSARDNDIFDNLPAGVQNEVSPIVSLPQTWWGDPRGPRGSADAAATGDSVVGNVNSGSWATVPHAIGTIGVEARMVRGDAQTAPRGTVLPRAFTVRVVDVAGRPVAGVSVTFKVTGGAGNFAGSNQVKIDTNASGLAEAILTLGASPGINTVTATGSGLNTLTIIATGT